MSQLSFGEGFGADEFAADPTFTVAELAEAINGALRRRFDDGVWVRGEIQGLNTRGPHQYFRLVGEGDGGKAVVGVQFFAPARNRLRPLLAKHRMELTDGLNVRIFGHLDYFAGGGTLGLKMAGIDPRFTLGDLAQQRVEVVRRLVAAGLYDANRSRPLSVAPLRIVAVTSADSAAWADFRHELARSGLAFVVELIDCRVQGDAAVEQVARALQRCSHRADVDAVVVIRGGGARTELAVFDAEPIATAIARSPHPVFTGLGHETDRCLADEVAFRSLKTPTACAAALVEAVMGFVQRSELAWSGVQRLAEAQLGRAEGRLADVGRSIRHRTVSALDRADERLTHRCERLARSLHGQLDDAAASLGRITRQLTAVPARLDGETRHLDQLEARVNALDPRHILARGWSITRTADGRTVHDATTVQAGDELITTLARGVLHSTVHADPGGRSA